jgi:hypothetical protein
MTIAKVPSPCRRATSAVTLPSGRRVELHEVLMRNNRERRERPAIGGFLEQPASSMPAGRSVLAPQDSGSHRESSGASGGAARGCDLNRASHRCGGYCSGNLRVGVDRERCGFHSAELHLGSSGQVVSPDSHDRSYRTTAWRKARDRRQDKELSIAREGCGSVQCGFG